MPRYWAMRLLNMQYAEDMFDAEATTLAIRVARMLTVRDQPTPTEDQLNLAIEDATRAEPYGTEATTLVRATFAELGTEGAMERIASEWPVEVFALLIPDHAADAFDRFVATYERDFDLNAALDTLAAEAEAFDFEQRAQDMVHGYMVHAPAKPQDSAERDAAIDRARQAIEEVRRREGEDPIRRAFEG